MGMLRVIVKEYQKMEIENQRLTGVIPAVSMVPALVFEAARVRRVDGQEVPEYPQPFHSLVDAGMYVEDTPVPGGMLYRIGKSTHSSRLNFMMSSDGGDFSAKRPHISGGLR
jgi:hypothetical protein